MVVLGYDCMIFFVLLQVVVGGDCFYFIIIGVGVLVDGVVLVLYVCGCYVLLFSDSEVVLCYLVLVKQMLFVVCFDLIIGEYVLVVGEVFKMLVEFGCVIEVLVVFGVICDVCVFVFGGGVVGDFVGFVVVCWMCGVDCVQLLIILLVMVDLLVGGKIVVDIFVGKNLVGVFYLLCVVIVDICVLVILLLCELCVGLVEVVKYGVLGDVVFFEWLQQYVDVLLVGEDVVLVEVIVCSCWYKVVIVECDLFEKGECVLFNFGYIFGYVIEIEQGYLVLGCDVLNYGEVVVVGMVLVVKLFIDLGLVDDVDCVCLQVLLECFGLLVVILVGFDLQVLFGCMCLDKKNVVGCLCLVLWCGMGCVEVMLDVDEVVVLKVLLVRQSWLLVGNVSNGEVGQWLV